MLTLRRQETPGKTEPAPVEPGFLGAALGGGPTRERGRASGKD